MQGEVVAVYDGRDNPRGSEVVIRHTPEDSGLPLYLYTRYTHFMQTPTLQTGQRVSLGDELGETGNSGLLGCEVMGVNCRGRSRRPALHFDVLYSSSPKYFDTGTVLVPFDAYWMDPNALYRKTLPADSVTMKALPETEKRVPISFRLTNGELVPSDTRMIWPYVCEKRAGSQSTVQRDILSIAD